ncbi:GNAT family N-acetyltransferase [Kitasatospora sp. MAP5-34]|uniref:GNAT family N-acetyltransferase n=1 Tax=Kitasatospora sp. MAP5-34 TaxID=3035102 RepID=UPI002472E998|nr:GNAT family N-acetyltransferase [Kitasatospora sp. MAP5-34]MDH6578674.1 putative acetyltransferase [Kitasatospora sp. MAP5-34]
MTADAAASDTSPLRAPTIRTLNPAEWDTWYRALEIAFGGREEEPEERGLWRELSDVDRALAAWDGPAVVGGAGAFSFGMAVPGGAVLPTAGVTMVGVLPTHRRRGLLTALMSRQLDDIHERGEALAVLTASEPAIYGRYGYGLGTWRLSLTIPRGKVRVHSPGDAAVRLRLADPAESSPACERLYASRVPLRPGMLERRPGWERLPLLDAPGSRGGYSPLQCVLAQDRESGRLLGYARYAANVAWGPTDIPGGTVKVRDVEAESPQVYAALWSFLLDLDLTETVTIRSRPVDDPLLHLVSDPRRLEPRLSDSLFVRLVDVGAALRERGYAAPVEVVLDVTDEFCPWNTGRWKLHSGGPGKGASCERTAESAELALNVRTLGSAYLGGTTLAALAAAGRVTELRQGALAEASRAFASDIAPWLPHGF